MPRESIEVVPFEPEHAGALVSLFERSENHCFCRYFHFSGDKYAWQDRLANAPDQNRRELLAAAEVQSPEARGVIALTASSKQAVGWLKVSRASDLDKLYEQRLYRRLPCFERPIAGVFTFGCFFVEPAYRRQGLSRELVRAGIALARTLGATSIEALPRGELANSDSERWLGRPSTFAAEGFRVVHEFEPYPVLRLTL